MTQTSLIFLHGWGGNHNSWYPILQALKTKYNLYAPDFPGFGQTPLPRPYQLGDYVDFLDNYIQTNHITSPVLIGHSFGGAVAAQFTIDHPEVPSKLVLVDAATIRYPTTLKQKVLGIILPPLRPLAFLPIIKTAGYRLLGLANSDYLQITHPNLKITFQNLIRDDLSSVLPQIKIPTLIIWGENDLSTPLSDGQKIHTLIKKSQLIIYPHESHFAYLNQAPRFTQDLINFIK